MNKNKKSENEKKKNFFLGFSQNQFFSDRKEVFPLFLPNGWADRAQNFFASTLVKLGCEFFFVSRNLVSKKFGRSYKTQILQKKRFSARFSVFCFSCLMKTIFFKKKHTHSNSTKLLAKKF